MGMKNGRIFRLKWKNAGERMIKTAENETFVQVGKDADFMENRRFFS